MKHSGFPTRNDCGQGRNCPPVHQSHLNGSKLKSKGGKRGACRCRSATLVPQQTERRTDPQIPADIKNSVVKLQAPNSNAPGGKTDVYILGMSHVSQESVRAVGSLIETVKPEVVVVEVCKDRVKLMMNPDGPKQLQLWNTRRIKLSGLPTTPGWPTEEELLSVISLRPEKAFTTPDAEVDCVTLLSTGLFKNARPLFKRPNSLDGPHFVKVKEGELATVPPLGTVEFLVTPRVLPPPKSFAVRIDSSLANAGIEVPEEEVKCIKDSLLKQFWSPEQLDSSEPEADNSSQPAESSTTDTPSSPQGDSSTSSESPLTPVAKSTEAESPQAESADRSTGENGASPQSEQNDEANESSNDDSAESETVKKNKEEYQKVKVASTDALLRARKELMDVLRLRTDREFDVSLQGVHDGRIEAVVKARQGQGYTCGLEGSAAGGEGLNIEKFKPQRGPLQVSTNLKIPNVAKVLLRDGENAEGYVTPETLQRGITRWTPWDRKLIDKTNMEDGPEDQKKSITEQLALRLTSLYGFLQAKAGETVGVQPGAAWMEALAVGADNGVQQIHLGDMPADLVGKDLTQGIWQGISLRVQAAALTIALATSLAVTHNLPAGSEPFAVGAVASTVALATLPFLAPLLEVYLFSRKSSENIEKTVRITQSLEAKGTEMVRLPGEDAIISWPNAKSTVIDQRDAYMARTLWAAATGGASSPAFILDTSTGRHAWHYLMPADAPESVSQEGLGLGTYKGLPNVKTVVGVVGSAHVGGIVREWESASQQDKLTELLTKQR